MDVIEIIYITNRGGDDELAISQTSCFYPSLLDCDDDYSIACDFFSVVAVDCFLKERYGGDTRDLFRVVTRGLILVEDKGSFS